MSVSHIPSVQFVIAFLGRGAVLWTAAGAVCPDILVLFLQLENLFMGPGLLTEIGPVTILWVQY